MSRPRPGGSGRLPVERTPPSVRPARGQPMAKAADSGARFRVLIGVTYNDDLRRAEPGDVVDDLPPNVIAAWLREGVIEKAVEEPPDSGTKARPVHIEKTSTGGEAA